MNKNKPNLIVPILVFFTVFSVKSQYFEGGAMIGFSFSQIDGDTYAGYHQPGLSGGFYSARDLGKNIQARMEIKYIAKGARETGTKEDPMEYSQKLRYIQVPLMVNYKLEKYNSLLGTGVGIGYLFHEKGEFDGSLLKDPYSKVEIDWIMALQYHINKAISVSAQFNYSLLPVRRYENTDYNYGFFSRTFWMTKGDYNNVIQLLLYYKFGK